MSGNPPSSIPSGIIIDSNISPLNIQRLENLFSRMAQSPALRPLLKALEAKNFDSLNPRRSSPLNIDLVTEQTLNSSGAAAQYDPIASSLQVSAASFEPSNFMRNALGQQRPWEWTIIHEIGHYLQRNSLLPPEYYESAKKLNLGIKAIASAYEYGDISYNKYLEITNPARAFNTIETDATEFANSVYKMLYSGQTSDFNYYITLSPLNSASTVPAIDYSSPLPTPSAADLLRFNTIFEKLGQPSATSVDAMTTITEQIFDKASANNINVRFRNSMFGTPGGRDGQLADFGPKVIRDSEGNIEQILIYDYSSGSPVLRDSKILKYELDENGNKVKDSNGVVRPELGYYHQLNGITSFV